jgi:hypothetical protein
MKRESLLTANGGNTICAAFLSGNLQNGADRGSKIRRFRQRETAAAIALFFFVFAATFSAAQEQPLPEELPPQSEPEPQNESSPDEPSLPDNAELVDIEYAEPEEEPDFDETALSRPPKKLNVLQRIGNALYGYLSAPAVTRHREPLRRFDWTLFSGNIDFANNLVGVPDILSETIKINGTELAERAENAGLRLNGGVTFLSAVDFNSNTKGFGFFLSMDGSVDMDVSDTLLLLLAKGNAGNTSVDGYLSVSGAVFADVGFHRYFDTGKWRVDIKPAWFLPLVYVPKSEVSYTVDSEDLLTVGASGTVDAYLPVDLDSGTLNNPGGLDFSVSVEYALFPILDVGMGLDHIPFMPARLTNKANVAINENILDNVSILDIIDDPDSLQLDFSPDYSQSSTEKYVTRPFSLSTWFLYRPFRTDLLTIKPNIGLTTNTPSGKTYLNVGLALELNVARVLFLRVQSGLKEGLWRHGAGVGFNMRVIQLDIEAALASQEYLSAWKGRGLQVGIGLHAGL